MKTSLFRSAVAALMLSTALAAPALAQNQTITGNVIVQPGTANESASYASTINNKAGVVTISPSLLLAGSEYTETITDSAVDATDVCQASVQVSANGTPVVTKVTPAAGSLAIVVRNVGSVVTSGIMKLSFICFK